MYLMKAPCSGKFVVRISPVLHESLKRSSEEQGISLNRLCEVRLSENAGLVGFPDLGEGLSWILSRLSERLQGVILFGSYARGEMTAGSDIDLLLVLRPGLSPSRQFYLDWATQIAPGLRRIHNREISPQFVAFPEEPEQAGSLWLEAAIDGIALWDPQLSVSKFLSKVRKKIAAGEIVRHETHGHSYWVRKRSSA
jgi:hypothetical protein